MTYDSFKFSISFHLEISENLIFPFLQSELLIKANKYPILLTNKRLFIPLDSNIFRISKEKDES